MSDPQGKSSSGGGKSRKNRVAVTKDLLGPRIMLDQQPAAGLFVLFAPVAPATSAGGGATSVPAVAPRFSACFIDGQGYPQTLLPDKNPWAEIADQLDNLVELRAKAEKDHVSGPVFAAKGCANPHVFKLVEGASYQLCLVGHPNPEVALAMQAYLNDGTKDPRFKFPKRADVLFEAKVQTDEDDGDKVAHIDLPTDSKRYWPPGHESYGGWVLYQGMPYAGIADVQKAVSRLAADLAGLRFPTGEKGKDPYPVSGGHSGIFGTTLMATVHAFQKDAAAGKALLRLTAPDDGTGLAASWSYLVASPLEGSDKGPPASDALTSTTAQHDAGDDPEDEGQNIDWKWDWCYESNGPKLATDANLGVGVVTAPVGEAIAQWKQAGYLKTGPILVQSHLDLACWGRPEMVVSLALWDLMAKALGCAYGIKLLCTFRELTVPAAVGRVECSNHKLGLSTDLLSEGFRSTKPVWPVHYEANWKPAKSPVVTQEDAKVKKARDKLAEAESKRARAQEHLDGLDQKEASGKRLRVGEREAAQVALKQYAEREEDAKAELTAEKAAAATLDQAVQEAKSNYLLCWRIYGHSSLEIWSAPKDPKDPEGEWSPVSTAALQAALADAFGVKADGPWAIEKRAAELVRGFFPPLGTAGPAADKIASIVAGVQAKARKIACELHQMAGDPGPNGLVACLFRRTIRPFDYNPFEADGGTSQPPQTLDGDGKLGQAKALFGRTPIRSYLNLSRLGFHCGMSRIFAQRGVPTGTFKRPDSDPEYKPKVAPRDLVFNLVSDKDKNGKPKKRKTKALSDALVLLSRALGDLAQAPDAGKPKVVLDGGEVKEVEVGDIDRAFVDQWVNLMKPESGLSFEDLALSLPLSADKKAVDARLKELEPFMGKTFMLVGAGARLSLDGTFHKKNSLRKWSEILADKAETSKSELQKLQPSRAKVSSEWVILLFPCFSPDVEGDGQSVALVFPPCGSPSPLEWWHHDSRAMSGSWATMAEAIGYSSVVVRAESETPTVVVNGQYQGGLGFDPKKVAKERTPSAMAPENSSDIPDGG